MTFAPGRGAFFGFRLFCLLHKFEDLIAFYRSKREAIVVFGDRFRRRRAEHPIPKLSEQRVRNVDIGAVDLAVDGERVSDNVRLAGRNSREVL